MPSDMARRRQARAARRLLLIFKRTIFTPGVILAGFGLRALTQERQHAELRSATRWMSLPKTSAGVSSWS